MEPFIISSSLSKMVEHHPDKNKILEVFYENAEEDLILLARQWLSEGIPFAFKNCPVVYELMRSWLSQEFNIHGFNVAAKEINLRGSARLGWSLALYKFGDPFHSKSDLDLFVISHKLFNSMSKDFEYWVSDYNNKIESPKNYSETKYWKSNRIEYPKNIYNGFIDSWAVPNMKKYKTFRKIKKILWELKKKLSITNDAPDSSKVSVRCFQSWNDWEVKVSNELKYLASKMREIRTK